MNNLFFNLTFFFLLLSNYSITSISTNIRRKKPQNQLTKLTQDAKMQKINNFKAYTPDEIMRIVNNYLRLSKMIPLQYFLVMVTAEDEFPIDFEPIQKYLNVYKYHVNTLTGQKYLELILIQNGQFIESKKMEISSDEIEEYSKYLIEKYKFKKASNEKQSDANKLNSPNENLYKSFLSKNSSKKQNQKQEKEEPNLKQTEKKENKYKRLYRFLWAFLLVIIFSIALFFLVKYSIDWATSGKNEINKQKEQKFREVTEVIFNKDF